MSIQDDIFDLDDHFKKKSNKHLKDAWERIYAWGCECENENERLRPIVGHMREAITLMFEKEDDS